jgi:hypothetical protein
MQFVFLSLTLGESEARGRRRIRRGDRLSGQSVHGRTIPTHNLAATLHGVGGGVEGQGDAAGR